MEALLFYQPAVRWVSGHMGRSVSCVATTRLFRQRRRGFLRPRPGGVGSGKPSPLAGCSQAANAGSLAHRIARLLGGFVPRAAEPLHAGNGCRHDFAGRDDGWASIRTVHRARPKFEVASIKPSGRGASWRCGRLRAGRRPPVRAAAHAECVHGPAVSNPGWSGLDRFRAVFRSRPKPTATPIVPRYSSCCGRSSMTASSWRRIARRGNSRSMCW